MTRYVKSDDGVFNLLSAVVRLSERDLRPECNIAQRDKRTAAEFLGYMRLGDDRWNTASTKSARKSRGGSRRGESDK